MEVANIKYNYERRLFLKRRPDTKYYKEVRNEFKKNIEKNIKKKIFHLNLVIKASNNLDEFVDSLIQTNNIYRYYIRSDSEIKHSIVKEKYFLCINITLNKRIFRNLPMLEKYQEKFPYAFISKGTASSNYTGYTIFSKDKIYKNAKLLSNNYASIVFIKSGFIERFDEEWHKELIIKLHKKNIGTQYTFANENFDEVEIRRIATPFYSLIDISKEANKCKKGGILLIKSGRKSHLIMCPECFDINNLIIQIERYFCLN